jgi:hypothetical protein
MVNFDYASLYPTTMVAFDDVDNAVMNLLQQRLNNKKMEDRLNKIDDLLNDNVQHEDRSNS